MGKRTKQRGREERTEGDRGEEGSDEGEGGGKRVIELVVLATHAY